MSKIEKEIEKAQGVLEEEKIALVQFVTEHKWLSIAAAAVVVVVIGGLILIMR